jgi:hypothetical protein
LDRGRILFLSFAIFLAITSVSPAQRGAADRTTDAQDLKQEPSMTLPDAPMPQTNVALAMESPDPPASSSSQAQQSSSDQSDTAQDTSSSQTSAQQPETQQSRHEQAEEQIKEEEKQRVVGVVPTFNITYRQDAIPLTAGQKMNLAFHSAVDPVTIGTAFVVAGYHEVANDLSGFSWGVKGYGERVGAAYLDSFNATMLSNAVFPILCRQDPRYFRLGHGTVHHRILYSLATNFVAKNDYNGKWGPNYGNILGNMSAGALSNLYYPNSNAGFGLTLTTTAIQIAEGAGGSIFNEFWPDISRKVLHKDPTHGLDAQFADEDRAK